LPTARFISGCFFLNLQNIYKKSQFSNIFLLNHHLFMDIMCYSYLRIIDSTQRIGEKSADIFLVKPHVHWVLAVSQSAKYLILRRKLNETGNL